MMLRGLHTLFVLAFPNLYMQLLYILTLSAILTWLFLNQKLNAFINAVFSIVGTALAVIIGSCISLVSRTLNVLFGPTPIFPPLRIPIFVKALICFLLGIAVLYIDHVYGARWFSADETIPFYKMDVADHVFWVSAYALSIGGFCIGLGSFYLVTPPVRAINALLSRPFQISIRFYV